MSLNDRVVEWGATNGANDFNAAKQRLTSGLSQDDVAVFAGASGYNEGLRFLAEGPDVLRDAVFLVDAAFSGAGESTVPNRGTGGSVLDAKYGSTTSSDTNDPLLLTHTGENYVYAGGSYINSISVSDEAALDVVGDIEIVVRCMWPIKSDVTLVSKWGNSSSRSYLLQLGSAGLVYFATTPDGFYTNRVGASIAITPLTAGTWYWMKVTRTVDNGAGGNTTNVYYADDQTTEPTDWTLAGSLTNAGTTSIFAGTDRLTVGGTDAGGTNNPVYIKRTIVRDGIGGSTVLDFAATTDITDSGATSFTATSGQTVTVNRHTSGRKTCLVTRPVWLFGTDDYMEVADNDLLDFGADDAFTVLAVARQWASFINQQMVSKSSITDAAMIGWSVATGASGQSNRFGDGTNRQVVSDALARSTGGLDAVFLVRDVDTDTRYSVVGNTAGTSATDTTTGTLANALPMRLGRYPDTSTAYADMELVAVAVFRRVLTADEIAAINTYYRTA